MPPRGTTRSSGTSLTPEAWQRLLQAFDAAEGGGVRLVRAPWNAAFLQEHEQFPLGEHDDQCLVGGTKVWTDLRRRRLDVGEVGGTVSSLGSRHTEVHELARRRRRHRPQLEAQSAAVESFAACAPLASSAKRFCENGRSQRSPPRLCWR